LIKEKELKILQNTESFERWMIYKACPRSRHVSMFLCSERNMVFGVFNQSERALYLGYFIILCIIYILLEFYTVNLSNKIIYALYFTCEKSNMSNQRRVQHFSHVKNINNQNWELKYPTNHKTILKLRSKGFPAKRKLLIQITRE
jgi:hypothetical protein